MFKTFFNFEIKHSLRTPMMYIFILVFALLTAAATCIEEVTIGGAIGNVYRNAPFVVQQFYAVMSIFGLFLATAFINAAALRDFENHTQQIVFSSPISKASYYFGHFLGSLSAAVVPLLGCSLGIVAGTFINDLTQNIDPAQFTTHHWWSHINSILVFVIPNLFFCGAIVYALAMTTRNTMYSYMATLFLLVCYIASGRLMTDMKNDDLVVFLDPLGIRTFSILTKYWSVADKNTMSIGPTGLMLASRILWMLIGAVILLIGYKKFSFAEKNKDTNKRKKAADTPKKQWNGQIPVFIPTFNLSTTLSQLANQTNIEVKGILRSTGFIILTVIGFMNMMPNLFSSGDGYGNTTYPVTTQMCDDIQGSFYLFIICVLTFFSGELVWKERQSRVNDIYDAMPTHTWTTYVSKLAALAAVVLTMMLLAVITSISVQAIQGYTNFQLGIYIKRIFVIDFLGFMYLGVSSMFIHSVVNNKYLGFFVFILFVILNSFMWGALDINTNMVNFANVPSYIYSDMNGFGPFVAGLVWFNLYWATFAALLGFITVLLWLRGRDTVWSNRLFNAKLNFKKNAILAVGLLGLWAVVAGFVYYNTKVLNKYQTSKELERMQVAYEKKYKRYKGISQPRIVDVKYNIELYPTERRLEAAGDYTIKNKTNQPIDSLHIVMQTRNGSSTNYQIDNGKSIFNDEAIGYQIFKLEPALAPGDSIHLRFQSTYRSEGFENEVSFKKILDNGSFFNNSDFAPNIGYQEAGELEDKNTRKKYDLPERERAPALEDNCTKHCMNHYISNHSDWVNVETTFGTTEGQYAIAPGSLVKDWAAGNRHYYQYKLDHKGLNFYSFMSAAYEIRRDKYKDTDIEIYYQKGHEYNVEKMVKSIQKSLDYYTTNFGPYYHKQCRIIEFPRYERFAQAFPGTMPYSERIGFIANLEDPEDIDMVYYVVAHEMGHQWWAHQVVGAEMQGGTLMSETFAQYSALMVMEKEYGRDAMRKFLKYEMDNYLRSRGKEREKELPLQKVENQGYVHYRKGSVVMYYLKEMIGEAAVNKSLKSFLERFRYQEPPYPTSNDVIVEFRRNTPDSLQYIIKDLFEDMTLFQNKTMEADMKKLPNGKYEVTIQTESQKFKADELGKESEVELNDWIEIGALAKPEGKKMSKILYRQRHKINKKQNSFTFTLDEKPDKVGIDPNFYLIDRMPEDNLKDIKE